MTIEKTNKKDNKLIIIILIFIICLWTTSFLFWYNHFKKWKISKLKAEIINIENNIQKIKQDENIIVYKMIKDNKTYLDQYKKLSDISKYVKHIDTEAFKYWLNFSNFSYTDWVINLKVSIFWDNKNSSATKLNNFLTDYRNNSEDKLFTLDEINNFDSTEWISFNTTYNLK